LSIESQGEGLGGEANLLEVFRKGGHDGWVSDL
jgi:hypothetical protein